MAKYRKKPVIIDAWRLDFDKLDERPKWVDLDWITAGEHAFIPTLEGIMKALPGDWLICGIRGEVYPCKPDIFEATYEKVS